MIPTITPLSYSIMLLATTYTYMLLSWEIVPFVLLYYWCTVGRARLQYSSNPSTIWWKTYAALDWASLAIGRLFRLHTAKKCYYLGLSACLPVLLALKRILLRDKDPFTGSINFVYFHKNPEMATYTYTYTYTSQPPVIIF